MISSTAKDIFLREFSFIKLSLKLRSWLLYKCGYALTASCVARFMGQTHACAIAQREQLSIAYIFYHYTSIIISLYKRIHIILLDNALEVLCVCVINVFD